MARIAFTAHLKQHLDCPPAEVAAGTLQEVLLTLTRDNPRLGRYILDDQGHLRRHVVVFIDGRMLTDRNGLSDPISENSEVFVMQALSGG